MSPLPIVFARCATLSNMAVSCSLSDLCRVAIESSKYQGPDRKRIFCELGGLLPREGAAMILHLSERPIRTALPDCESKARVARGSGR